MEGLELHQSLDQVFSLVTCGRILLKLKLLLLRKRHLLNQLLLLILLHVLV
jgi:hypothetical protein